MSNLPCPTSNPAPPYPDDNTQNTYDQPSQSGYPYAPSEHPPSFELYQSSHNYNTSIYPQESNVSYNVSPHPGETGSSPDLNHNPSEPEYPTSSPLQVHETEPTTPYFHTGSPGPNEEQKFPSEASTPYNPGPASDLEFGSTASAECLPSGTELEQAMIPGM